MSPNKLKKEDIIRILNALSLPFESYWILAGSGLVMHGIRELTNDIDIGCTTELFNKLAQNNSSVKTMDDGNRALVFHEVIEVFENWNVNGITVIAGLPVATVASIKKHKEKLGRKKDLDDLKLIDSFLSR